jgi:DNA-binding CsgD family transcriptional regulator
LTPREQEIYNLLIEGKTLKEIAYSLKIKYPTSVFHQKKLFNKLGVQSINEFLTKYNSNSISDDISAPCILASREKPFIITLYDNSKFNPPWGWQYIFTPPIFIKNKITAGDIYTFSYSFSSNIDFDWFLVYLADTTKEANLFTLLCTHDKPTKPTFNNGKAGFEYDGSVCFDVIKNASSREPDANVLFIDIFSNSKTPPTLTFSRFEIIKH